MQVVFLVFLFIMGACFGSFLCCQARRLRFKEQKGIKSITHSKKAKFSKASKSSIRVKSKTKPKTLPMHSICLSCKTRLKWRDNLPIISWLILKGKCRKCGQRIGRLEIFSELGVAFAFLLLGLGMQLRGLPFETLLSYPTDWIVFVMVLAFTLLLSFLAIYDGAYGELPNIPLIFAVILGAIIAIVSIYSDIIVYPDFFPQLGIRLGEVILSVTILGGLYLALYLISKGKWVGNGDWLLGTAIALTVGSPWLSLIILFLSNFLACLIMIPLTKGNRKQKIHLGPFMVAAFVITISFSEFFISVL